MSSKEAWIEACFIVLVSVMIAIIVSLQGCSYQTPLVDSEEDRGVVIVTKPPMRVIYRGVMNENSLQFASRLCNSVGNVDYHDYNFTKSIYVRINTIDGRSDNVAVNLHETNATK